MRRQTSANRIFSTTDRARMSASLSQHNSVRKQDACACLWIWTLLAKPSRFQSKPSSQWTSAISLSKLDLLTRKKISAWLQSQGVQYLFMFDHSSAIMRNKAFYVGEIGGQSLRWGRPDVKRRLKGRCTRCNNAASCTMVHLNEWENLTMHFQGVRQTYFRRGAGRSLANWWTCKRLPFRSDNITSKSKNSNQDNQAFCPSQRCNHSDSFSLL